MDKKEKAAKKAKIAKKIKLGNSRLKDEEVNILSDIVENIDKYLKNPKKSRDQYDGWSSDGKYTRTTDTEYRFQDNSDGIRIVKEEHYHDDDGQTGDVQQFFDSARDIVNIFKKVFK